MKEFLEMLKKKFDNNERVSVDHDSWIKTQKEGGSERNYEFAKDVVESAKRTAYAEIYWKLLKEVDPEEYKKHDLGNPMSYFNMKY